MYYVAQTKTLVVDGVIDPSQAREIETRARAAMVALSINSLLIAGIVAATLGLVFWLADPLSVAGFGMLALVLGLLILRYGSDLYRMFGNASALIGSGMLVSGAGIELVTNYETVAGPVMLFGGALLGALAGGGFLKGPKQLGFALGSVFLMGVALHIAGLYFSADRYDLFGRPMPFLHVYVFAVIAGSGLLLDLRVITAVAIVPFAQILDTGSTYFHAAYVFYSPESTLSIIQMSLLVGACLWAGSRWGDVIKRQAGILAIMGFIVANLCFLVGSLWGDVVGEYIWGPGWGDYSSDAYATREAFRASALVISEQVYAVVWGLLLAGIVAWAAFTNRRGMFNVGMTFAAIHAYTQVFEAYWDEPLAYVIGGLAAIPLAWGLWRLNERFKPAVEVGGV